MGNFRHLLKHFTKLSKLEEMWRHRGELAALRGVYLGVASILSILIGIIFQYFSGSVLIALFASTSSLPLLFPLSILIASKHWKERKRIVINNRDDFNWIMFLSDEYQEQLRKIAELDLEKPEADKLKITAFQEHQEILRNFHVELAKRPRLSINSFEDLHEVFRDLKNNAKDEGIKSKIEDLEKNTYRVLKP